MTRKTTLAPHMHAIFWHTHLTVQRGMYISDMIALNTRNLSADTLRSLLLACVSDFKYG